MPEPDAARALPLGGRARRRRPARRAACCSPPAAAASRSGPFASLNLGRLTADDGANVDANRERLAAAVGLPARALPLRPPGPRRRRPPRHRAARRRAARRRGGRPGDRAAATPPALVFVADCLPVLLAADGARRRAARRLARAARAGSSPRASRALRELGADGRARAPRSGPARAAAATRSARRSTPRSPTSRRPRGGAQPRPAARSRATSWRRPASATVHDTGLCTMCDRASSSPTGATAASPAARRGSCGGPDAERVRANLERIRAEIDAAARRAGPRPGRRRAARGGQVRRREDVGALAEAGLTLLGENRAQELEAKAAAQPGRFRWHFIGQLQSRKVKPDPAARRADPLRRVGLRAAPARAPRRRRTPSPRRGQRRAARRARPGSPRTSCRRSSSAARSASSA